MCPRVCVGALVGERPLAGPLHVGELISFHPPGDDAETYTHEVARILPDGAIETRGIANPGHDPWLIERSDIVGKVDFTVWELGWLFKALPLFAVGTLFWVSARPFIGERWRRSWDRGCLTVLTVVPLWLLHPLVRASVIASTLEVPGHPHWASDSVVDTGILPAWFAEAGGRAVRVSSDRPRPCERASPCPRFVRVATGHCLAGLDLHDRRPRSGVPPPRMYLAHLSWRRGAGFPAPAGGLSPPPSSAAS